eukprot:CAMPEP_0118636226 /NCGR_PEP_ID=MMETSP0785-20121206/2501_1 /TAXON_ID=91992 /ORGANISM="Bolidomonas pacifica, Strain CCMP 1866" /LENGTH=398 /DNA_ID=CAMNT_0006527321 /DNA_START=103 /DNA_END=1297 /DNA_ORIENTATION=-
MNGELKIRRRLADLSTQLLQYEDPQLIQYARTVIPERLLNRTVDEKLVLDLVIWFKCELFTWVNKPKCVQCGKSGKEMVPQASCPPVSPLEKAGRASRVEVYRCSRPGCGATTRFPRYNDPKILLSPAGRRGRCGEYANAFTCVLRAVGFEARYVLDFTDHVWCEFFSEKESRWIHVDPCEAKVDSCGIYEKGWNKKLSYIFAASKDEICDVSGKYCRLLSTSEVKQRRSMCPELILDQIIWEEDRSHKLKTNPPSQRLVELQRRRDLETQFMSYCQGKDWGDVNNVGRQSGSHKHELEGGYRSYKNGSAGYPGGMFKTLKYAGELTAPFKEVVEELGIKDEFVKNWLDMLCFLLQGLPADGAMNAVIGYMLQDWYKPGVVLDFPVGGSGGIVDALVE